MSTQNKGGDVANRHIKFFGQEMAETSRIQNAGHADHFIFWQARGFLQGPNHGIQRVSDTNHESIGRIFFDALAHLAHHFQINTQQIVAAHARLTRYARRHDHYIGALNAGVRFSSRQSRIEATHGRALSQIQGFPLRNAVYNIENNNIAELF